MSGQIITTKTDNAVSLRTQLDANVTAYYANRPKGGSNLAKLQADAADAKTEALLKEEAKWTTELANAKTEAEKQKAQDGLSLCEKLLNGVRSNGTVKAIRGVKVSDLPTSLNEARKVVGEHSQEELLAADLDEAYERQLRCKIGVSRMEFRNGKTVEVRLKGVDPMEVEFKTSMHHFQVANPNATRDEYIAKCEALVQDMVDDKKSELTMRFVPSA